MAKIDKLIALAREHLQPGEEVLAGVFGAYETKTLGQATIKNGVLIATPDRIFFYGKRTFGYDSESFPFSNISSVETGKGLMGKTVTFFASGNKVSMKYINEGDYDQFIQIAQSKIGKKSSNAESVNDPIEQLKRLAELKESGIITEDEFAAKKKQVLGI
ncbi:PH domain-containing protein [Paenibacillus wenxiniae]|uniref:PH domain-containing protein n=1 Tax=Paenibacillus wenxiniae TaxID=1636843 RepID=A0ABW4RGZ1_9BACL